MTNTSARFSLPLKTKLCCKGCLKWDLQPCCPPGSFCFPRVPAGLRAGVPVPNPPFACAWGGLAVTHRGSHHFTRRAVTVSPSPAVPSGGLRLLVGAEIMLR